MTPSKDRPTVQARLRTAATVVTLASVALAGQPVSAQDSPQDPPQSGEDSVFAVQPSGSDGPGTRDWFNYTLDPGDVFGDVVAVSNLSDRPVRFRIYATDAISLPDTGGFAALKDDEEPTDVGTWIELAASEYTVAPRTRIDVPFSIEVPDDAEPGDHAGAILAVDADDSVDVSPDGNGIGFDILARMGARVYVRVSGEATPALRIDDLDVERDGSRATVTWDVSNTGNIRLSPSAEVRITGFLGRTVATARAVQLPELLPGANVVAATSVDGLGRFERLTAHLVVSADGVRVERSTGFGSHPWWLVALLVLAGGGAVLWWRRRRRRRRAAAATPPQPPTARVPELV